MPLLIYLLMPEAPATQNIIAPYDPTGQPHFTVLFLHPNGKHWDTIIAMRDHVHVQEDNGRFLFSFWPNWTDFQFLFTLLKLTRTWAEDEDVQYFCAGHPIERDQIMRPMACIMRMQCQERPGMLCPKIMDVPSESFGQLRFMLPCFRLLPGLKFTHGVTYFSEVIAGHAEERGYLFCPLYNPMVLNGPLLTERFQPQPGVNRTLSGGICIGIRLPKKRRS